MAVDNFLFASYPQNVTQLEATVTGMVRGQGLEKAGLRELPLACCGSERGTSPVSPRRWTWRPQLPSGLIVPGIVETPTEK